MHSHIKLPNGRTIGPGYPAYIIAEIGSNYDGRLERAKDLIAKAKDCGADAVKFQSFQVHKLINAKIRSDNTWKSHPAWDILKKLTLPAEWHAELHMYAQSIGIDFISTPFDLERLQLLVDINVPFIKIASGDLVYHELIQAAAKTGKPVVLATGAATLGEIESALNVFYAAGGGHVAILQCVSTYPAHFENAHLRVLTTLQNAFQIPVGYSDHTPGSAVPVGAVALGATIIEKHFTDDKTLPGPDHHYALDIPEFTQMVKDVHHLESALGESIKRPRGGEVEEKIHARRSLYAESPIVKGTVISREHLRVVRPYYPEESIPASLLECILGAVATQDIASDELITWEKLQFLK